MNYLSQCPYPRRKKMFKNTIFMIFGFLLKKQIYIIYYKKSPIKFYKTY